LQVRRLTVADYDGIVNLWSIANLPYKPKGRDSREAIAAEIKLNPDFFLGAFDEERLVGVAVVSCDSRKGWINRLAVHPDFRRRGIAVDLIDECESAIRKLGLKLFCALIEESNEPSIRLFKKRGYVEHRDILYFCKRESDDV
jgi:ribosomal protein S18 acetylase RimI-like enzyme